MDAWLDKPGAALHLWKQLTPVEALQFLSISSSARALGQPDAICAAAFALTRPHFDEESATLDEWIRIWNACVHAAKGDARVWTYPLHFTDAAYMASEGYLPRSLVLQLDQIVERKSSETTCQKLRIKAENFF